MIRAIDAQSLAFNQATHGIWLRLLAECAQPIQQLFDVGALCGQRVLGLLGALALLIGPLRISKTTCGAMFPSRHCK